MELIEGFNIALETAGLRNISDINIDDPQTAQLDTIINREKINAQRDGWPFNTDRLDLVVNIDGVIDVSGFLDVELPEGLQILDDKVWNPATSSFYDRTLNDVWVILDRQWDDIPHTFQLWIARRAGRAFTNAINGPDDVWQAARQREGEAASSAWNSKDAKWDNRTKQDRRSRTGPHGGTMDSPGWGGRGVFGFGNNTRC